MRQEFAMSKATGVMHKHGECRQQGHGTRHTEAQVGGALTILSDGRLHYKLNAFLGEMTVVADELDVRQTSIDLSTDLLQEG
jgi:hypothetical protein